MDKREARRALSNAPLRRRGKAPQFTPEQLRQRNAARGRAKGKVHVALARLHPDEYRVMYDIAVEEELAKL
jgi:hypothetical protein